MLVSTKHRLVILSMPKCASTSLERALAPQMDVVFQGQPAVKHTSLRTFNRLLRPYIETVTKEPVEVVSLMREPLSWLHSWWRYRGRDGMPAPENSTKGMPFADFVALYLDGRQKPADVGQQSAFLADHTGAVGVDKLFRYEHLSKFVTFLEARLGVDAIKIGHENRSPRRRGRALPPDLTARLHAELAVDWEIYERQAV